MIDLTVIDVLFFGNELPIKEILALYGNTQVLGWMAIQT